MGQIITVFSLFIQTPSEQVELEVDENDTIAMVKSRLEAKVGSFTAKLLYEGSETTDSLTLAEYGIQSNCTMRLVPDTDERRTREAPDTSASKRVSFSSSASPGNEPYGTREQESPPVQKPKIVQKAVSTSTDSSAVTEEDDAEDNEVSRHCRLSI